VSPPRVKVTGSARTKLRAINAAIKQRAGGQPCAAKIVVGKGGARSCSTCGAKAATAKTIMLCARTGRLPGVKA
jgi:hypothetical protein